MEEGKNLSLQEKLLFELERTSSLGVLAHAQNKRFQVLLLLGMTLVGRANVQKLQPKEPGLEGNSKAQERNPDGDCIQEDSRRN